MTSEHLSPNTRSPSEWEIPLHWVRTHGAGGLAFHFTQKLPEMAPPKAYPLVPLSSPAPGCQGHMESNKGRWSSKWGWSSKEGWSISLFLLPQKPFTVTLRSSWRPSVSPCGGSWSFLRKMKMTQTASRKGDQ